MDSYVVCTPPPMKFTGGVPTLEIVASKERGRMGFLKNETSTEFGNFLGLSLCPIVWETPQPFLDV